jgi:hypothetical protein
MRVAPPLGSSNIPSSSIGFIDLLQSFSSWMSLENSHILWCSSEVAIPVGLNLCPGVNRITRHKLPQNCLGPKSIGVQTSRATAFWSFPKAGSQRRAPKSSRLPV